MGPFLLPPPPADYNGPQMAHPVACVVQKEFQASGRAFEEFYCKLLGLGADDAGAEEAQEAKGKRQRVEQKKRGVKAAKLSEADLEADHYEVLGLEKLEWLATDEDIKTAYRRLVVETHPDKTQGGDDTRFKAVQKAYEILSDPARRLAFDSSLPFDDDIPSLKVAPENFFEVYGEAFHRNSRWSTARNVPQLGDVSTPYEEVESFYEFWTAFRSWRDFSNVDMHNVEEAECREEKRWMDRENERERSKLQKQESKRIRELVERARMLDPRLKKRKEDLARKREEEKKAVEEKKQKKLEAKLQKQRDAEEAEERRKKEEADKKKAEQAKRKEETAALRDVCSKTLKPFISPDTTKARSDAALVKADVEWLFRNCQFEGLAAMKLQLETLAKEHQATLPNLPTECTTALVTYINQLVAEAEQRIGYDRFGYAVKRTKVEPEKKQQPEATDGKKDVWTEQELVDLAKGIAKFPGGSFNRWENIAAYIGTKTPDQVLRRTKLMTHQLHEGQPPTKPEAIKQGDAKPLKSAEEAAAVVEDPWTKAQQKQLEDALKTLKEYKEKDKWDKVAALVEGKTKKQCVERYKYLATLFKK
eukprot:EG_transcript_6619